MLGSRRRRSKRLLSINADLDYRELDSSELEGGSSERNGNAQNSGCRMKNERMRGGVKKGKPSKVFKVGPYGYCTMLSFLKTMRNIKHQLREGHLELLKQTPFWPLISAFYDGMISESDCKRSSGVIQDIIQCYSFKPMCFQFGSTSASLTPEDISTILGLPLEGERIKMRNGQYERYRYTSDFTERYFKNRHPVTKKMVDDGLRTAIQGNRGTDTEDVVRLIILDLFITFLFCNGANTIGWKLIERCEELQSISTYSWAKAVVDFLSNSLEKKSRQSEGCSIGGCVVVLLFWLCERTNLIQPINGREEHTPALIKWNIQKLQSKLQMMDNLEEVGLSFQGNNEKENGKGEDGKGTEEKEDTQEDRLEEESVSDDIVGSLEDDYVRAEMLNGENEYLERIKEKDLCVKEKLNIEYQYQVVCEEKLKVERKCSELEESQGILMREKLNAENKCRDLEEHHTKHESMIKERLYEEFKEKHNSLLLENLVAKYKLEFLEKEKAEDKLNLEGMLNLHNSLEAKYQSVLKEKIKVKEKYATLKQKHKVEVMEVDKKCATLREKHELELLKVQNEAKEHEQKHQLELNECKDQLERYMRLIEDVKRLVNNGRKDVDKELIFELPRESNESKLINEKGLGSRKMEKRSEDGGMTDDRVLGESSARLINLEDVISVPSSDTSTRNGDLRTSGTPKFSHVDTHLIIDIDDDCAREENPKVLKRKLDSSLNTAGNNTGKMKQARKLSHCGSLVHHVSETVADSHSNDKGK